MAILSFLKSPKIIAGLIIIAAIIGSFMYVNGLKSDLENTQIKLDNANSQITTLNSKIESEQLKAVQRENDAQEKQEIINQLKEDAIENAREYSEYKLETTQHIADLISSQPEEAQTKVTTKVNNSYNCIEIATGGGNEPCVD